MSDTLLMSSQSDLANATLQNVQRASESGYDVTLYIKPPRDDLENKRYATLVINPDYEISCLFDVGKFGFRPSTMDSVYPAPFNKALFIELGEIESDEEIEELLDCLEPLS